MIRPLMTAIAVILPVVAIAQSDSKSMAECAAIYAASNTDRVSDNAQYVFEYGQTTWLNAAVIQAHREGVDDPAGMVDAVFTRKHDEFAAQGTVALFSDSYGAWMDYCRSFAHAQGISLMP